MVSMMTKDQSSGIGAIIGKVETIIDDLFVLMAVFDKYEGGDFCTGLIFGKNGAKLLTQVAQTGFDWYINPKAQDRKNGLTEQPGNLSQNKTEDVDTRLGAQKS